MAFLLAFLIPLAVATPAVPSAVPTHVPTYVSFAGGSNGLTQCWHNNGGPSNPSGCPGSMPTPGPSGSTGDWRAVAPYIDSIDTTTALATIANQAGVNAGVSVDAFQLHGSIVSGGTTYTPTTYPSAITLRDRYTNYAIVAPNLQPTTVSGSVYGAVLGDPTSPASWSFWARAVAALNAQSPDNGQSGPYQFVREGTATYPADLQTNGAILCYGPASADTGSPPYTCANTSNNTALSYDSSAYLALYAGAHYMAPAWTNGVRNLSRTLARQNMQVWVGGIATPNELDPFWGLADNGGATWVESDYAFTRNTLATGTPYWSETSWQNQVNTELAAQYDGLGFAALNTKELNAAEQMYGYASLLLGMANPNSVAYGEDITGGALSVPASGVPIAPIVNVVPTQPVADPPNLFFDPFVQGYTPAAPSLAYGVGALKTLTGAYAREFAACYVQQVNAGACAVVVNPTASMVYVPVLSRPYAHALSWTGNGIITPSQFGGGDTYTISTTSNTAPGSLAPHTATVLFN